MVCIFIVQASASIGIGHLMRCMALAQTLEALEADVYFLLDEESAAFARSRHDWPSKIVDHDYAVSLSEQIKAFQHTFTQKVDWVVIDGYQFDGAFCQAWRAGSQKVMLFDDGVHHRPLNADLIVNAGAETLDSEENQRVLVGSQYRLLRREFLQTPSVPFEQRRILTVNFGGSDPLDLTSRVLQALESANFKGLVRAVTGPAYPQTTQLKKLIASLDLTVQHIHNAQQMADLWGNTRLAVSAAGGSQFELACMATPSIFAIVAENQLQASHSASQQGWCEFVDFTQFSDSTDSGIKQIVDRVMRLWSDEALLSKMHQTAGRFADPNGAERVAAIMFNC